MRDELEFIGAELYKANLLNMAQNGDKVLKHIVKVGRRMYLTGYEMLPKPTDYSFMGFNIEDLVAWIPEKVFEKILKNVKEKEMKGNLLALVLREFLFSEYKERLQKMEGKP